MAACATFAINCLYSLLAIAKSANRVNDTSNGWMLVLTGLFIFAVCVAGAVGVWYFILR